MMENRKWGSEVCLVIVLFILCGAPLSLGKEKNVVRTQGLINSGGDLKAGYLLINEMRIYIDRTTQIMDDHQVAIPAAHLRPKRWVFMEIEKGTVQNAFKAKKIYLLPHYVNQKERKKFSFME